jgi:hypothetical protein
MDKAKAAVSNFHSTDGKHETINPAIESEQVTRTEQENVQSAVDREVHQSHYHTSVQPIQHQEVLHESHTQFGRRRGARVPPQQRLAREIGTRGRACSVQEHS